MKWDKPMAISSTVGCCFAFQHVMRAVDAFRKRSAHNPAREPLVVNPPFFILKGFPRFWSEKDRLWQVPGDSGNPELTQTLSAFKDDLESGVKVQYARGGAFGEGILMRLSSIPVWIRDCKYHGSCLISYFQDINTAMMFIPEMGMKVECRLSIVFSYQRFTSEVVGYGCMW